MNHKRNVLIFVRVLLLLALLAGLLQGSNRPAVAATQIDIPGPTGSGTFGASVIALPNGNFVVTDPLFDGMMSVDVGAVFLYNGASGAVISMLTGNQNNDQVGSGGVTVLSNGNFVVSSPNWDRGILANAGAVTWGSATAGVSGIVSSSNSLLGSTTGDQVGKYRVTALSNGNYVVRNPDWDNIAMTDAGAVTWGDGTSGVSGSISALNSLVGSKGYDQVGNGSIAALSNGNYVVRSYHWDNGPAMDAGAVTWGDGDSGTIGIVSTANSLVGSKTDDQVGQYVEALSNGNYVVSSYVWDNGAIQDAGAATWGNGTSGVIGPVSDANSLVGSQTADHVGLDVDPLSNGNYVVGSPDWDNGAVPDAGAVTWGNGTSGISGPVSAANSLVGSSAFDQVGYTVTALNNGNYVVSSPYWKNGLVTDAGAVTWKSGTSGTSGAVSTSNSLVGSQTGDQVGSEVELLSNGNYVVSSPDWDNGGFVDAGAVTWGNGASGTTGAISAANSLVGSTAGDQVGAWDSVRALSNGNYVVRSTAWDNSGVADAGAVTWGSGTGGVKGVISAANSLVGSTSGDQVGSGILAALSNGNYVVSSPGWDSGGVVDVGAVTWGNGAGGTFGAVSAAKSLVGSTTDDHVGSRTVTSLSNGNYVVLSTDWDNGAIPEAGAVTWGNGTSGIIGTVSAANSLVGSQANDKVGDNIFNLSNGNFVVTNKYWDNGALVDAGAITWGNGTSGTFGPIAAANSVRGTAASGGATMNFDYDAVNNQLVVGRPADNIVTLFKMVHGLTVIPPTDAKSAAPGITVNYTLRVTNAGNIADAFNLAVSGNDWTTNAPATVGQLAAGASQVVTVSVVVPASAAGGSTDTATITVTSLADPSKSDSVVLTTTAKNIYGVTVTPATGAKSGAPGSTVSYSLAVQNTGNTAASFNVTIKANKWTTTVPAAVGPVAAGGSQNVTVSVSVPASAIGGSKDIVTITVTSQADPSKVDTAVLTTTAANRKIYMPVMRK